MAAAMMYNVDCPLDLWDNDLFYWRLVFSEKLLEHMMIIIVIPK